MSFDMIGEPTTPASDAAAELRARRARGVAVPGRRLPWGTWAVGFCAAALLLNALIGQNGYFETQRLEQQYAMELAKLHALRLENQRLKAYGRALRSDPATIEDAARRRLGMIKPGEILFIVSDTPSAAPRTPTAPASPSAPGSAAPSPTTAAPSAPTPEH